MTARARAAMPLAEALDAKWREGQSTYGPEWQGDDPLVEAHDDGLDVLLYLREHERRTGEMMRPTVRAITQGLLDIRARIRREVKS